MHPLPAESTQAGGSDDRDSDENVQKRKKNYNENNTFARASVFQYISLPSLHEYDVSMPSKEKKRRPYTDTSISVSRQSSEILHKNSDDFLSQILPITKTRTNQHPNITKRVNLFIYFASYFVHN